MKPYRIALLSLLLVTFAGLTAYAEDGYDLWLSYHKLPSSVLTTQYRRALATVVLEGGQSETIEIIRDEMTRGLQGLLNIEAAFAPALPASGGLIIATPTASETIGQLGLSGELAELGPDGFILRSIPIKGVPSLVLTAHREVGLLYGTFALLRLMQTGQSLTDLDLVSHPRIQYRLLNHWDNPDGSVERGYAGQSLWQWDQLPQRLDPRYHDYARANASLGINGSVVNNVNADPNILSAETLTKLKALAEVFRPYGIKLYISIRFSSPLKPGTGRRGGMGNLDTADPLAPKVRRWWKDKVDEIYAAIPDFGGFLVKANSEGMPGPQDYDRTHAEGANMLAEALAPHGGIVMWRAFVYDADADPDRAKRAYKEFVPLNDQFKGNVFVQSKNGPIDFQPREPIQPLFGALPQTPLMLELQITQEYLGHSTHLVYLAPMWKECLDFDTHARGQGSSVAKVIDGSVHNYAMTGIAGVANTGSDRNWCGHLFGQANWYAYGRLAWDHQLSSESLANEWIRMTLSRDDRVVQTIKSMMMGSWQACINYMTPLGLHHIMQEGFHYGPQPDYARAEREDWASVYYHRADSKGVGFDRSPTGSNAAAQYFSPWKERFSRIESCPEKYLLWFHHVPWDHRLQSGQTLWQELCRHYDIGVDYVRSMRQAWDTLSDDIDPELFRHVQDKLTSQERDAQTWRDTCLNYFQTFSQMPLSD